MASPEVHEAGLGIHLFAGVLERLIVGASDGGAVAVLVGEVGGPHGAVAVGDLADGADLVSVACRDCAAAEGDVVGQAIGAPDEPVGAVREQTGQAAGDVVDVVRGDSSDGLAGAFAVAVVGVAAGAGAGGGAGQAVGLVVAEAVVD